MVYLIKAFCSSLKTANFVSSSKQPTTVKSNVFLKIAKVATREVGDNVLIRGWIKKIRKMKTHLFIDVNDGSCHENLQIVVPKSEDIDIGFGQSIEACGIIEKSPQMKNELRVCSNSNWKIIGDCKLQENYPFTPKQTHAPEYVREYLHLRSRVDYMNSVFRVRHHASKILNDYMYENDFIQIHTPILTTNDCEGAGEVFLARPDNDNLLKNMAKENKDKYESYFDKKTFLSVSGQMHLETMTHGLGNTYTFSPVFRAENSKSNLHLSEFYMFEAELAFIDNLKQLTDFIENLIKTVTERIINKCSIDIYKCNTEKPNLSWIDSKWQIITYDEGFKILDCNKSKLKSKLILNDGFSKEQELFLVDYLKSPIFIIDWPKSGKPFYMKESITDPEKVHAVDLLMPSVGELVGGSLRENDYNKLKNSIPNGLDWYLDLRKFGNISTGGFGLGFERYLQLITNIKSIRDVIPFPRYPHSCLT